MRYTLQAIAWLTLISGLVLPGIAPYEAVYVTLVGLVVLTIWVMVKKPARANAPVTWILVAATSLLVVSTLLTDPGVGENWLAPVIILLSLLSVGFLSLPSVAPRLARTEIYASLALLGAGLGVVVGTYELWFGFDVRAGAGNNPIHYGGIVLLLGASALAGLESSKARWRYVFLLGPALGMAGVFLSGSRGPFLAAGLLMAILLPLIFIWNWRNRVFLLGLAVGAAICVASLAFSPMGPRALSVFGGILSALSEGNFQVLDEPRSHMLTGAWHAFLESPVWGHGWAQMMPAAEAHFPQGSVHKGYDHLHNDVADFAVLGGMLGLVAYGLLCAAPWFAWNRVPPEHKRPYLILAIVITVGFIGLGLTNAVIGVLPQTVLYAVLMGILPTRQSRDVQE